MCFVLTVMPTYYYSHTMNTKYRTRNRASKQQNPGQWGGGELITSNWKSMIQLMLNA